LSAVAAVAVNLMVAAAVRVVLLRQLLPLHRGLGTQLQLAAAGLAVHLMQVQAQAARHQAFHLLLLQT
jgi:hypothetical protein